MSALRKALETIHEQDFVKWGGLTGPALQLNSSREVTEKKTKPYCTEGSHAVSYLVTNHKARGVLDGS